MQCLRLHYARHRNRLMGCIIEVVMYYLGIAIFLAGVDRLLVPNNGYEGVTRGVGSRRLLR